MHNVFIDHVVFAYIEIFVPSHLHPHRKERKVQEGEGGSGGGVGWGMLDVR